MDVQTVNKQCDNCQSWFVFLTTRDIYNGQQFSGWKVIYYCGDCGASVGTHPDTTTPLGPMATGKTRFLRAKAHEAFDPIWRSGLLSRAAAIRWAAQELLIVEEFHISTLPDKTLSKLIKISKEYLANKGIVDIERNIVKTNEKRMLNAKRVDKHNAIYAKRRKRKR